MNDMMSSGYMITMIVIIKENILLVVWTASYPMIQYLI